MRYITLAAILSINLAIANAQMRINAFNKKCVEFSIANTSNTDVCYYDPFFSIDVRKRQTYKIRYDRMDEVGDTLVLYLNDTTILKGLQSRNLVDESNRRIKSDWNMRLPVNHTKTYKLYFRKPKKYSFVKIYYSFSLSCAKLETLVASIVR